MVGPASSNSALVIHIDWKVDSDERMEPPIHTEYLRSGGATSLIFMVEGARAVNSFCIRSAMPIRGKRKLSKRKDGKGEAKETLEHGGTAGQDDVGIQILTDIDIALLDGGEGGLVDTLLLETDEGRLEQHFGGTETLRTNGDDLTVGQLIGLFAGR